MSNEQGIYASKEYKKSRLSYKLECMFEHFAALMIADAYLSSLLMAIGMPDYMIGILASVSSFAFCFQLITMVLVQRVTNTKRFASLVHFVGRLFFVTLYFVPFFDFVPQKHKPIIAAVCIILGYFGNYVVTSMIYKWGNSFVSPTKRATFSATKEMLSLAGGMAFNFIMGRVVDHYGNLGRSETAFLFLGLAILATAIADFVCLLIMKKEDKQDERVEIVPIKSVIGSIFKNKGFVAFLILDCLNSAAGGILVGFVGSFKLKELGMTVGLVSIVNIFSDGMRFALSKPIGKFSDKTSFVTGITLGLAINMAALAFIIFINPKMWWLIIGYSVLYSVSAAATGQNSLNAVFSYVDKAHFVQAISIKNCISGVLGFLVSLVGGVIVGAVQGESGMGMLNVFGIQLYAQQVLAIISLAITVIAFIFAQLVVRKQKVMIQ